MRLLARSRLVLPAAATGALCFSAGGFFPRATALAALAALLALLLRVTLGRRPWEGWSAGLSVGAGALAVFAVWILASSQWSGAPGRALLEFDRSLLYLAAFVLMGLFARRPGDLGVLLLWVAAVACGVCVAALLTRLAPGAFPTDPSFVQTRLSFPLTYWNTLGALAAIGLVLALHITSSIRQPAVARVLAAAVFPAVVVALYFTFSRGGAIVAIAGLLVYLVLGHSRGLLPGLLAIGPTTAIALSQAYNAELLSSDRFDQAVAASQREDLLRTVVICMVVSAAARALLLLADAGLARIRLSRGRRLAGKAVAAGLMVAVAVGALASGLPDKVEQERQKLLHSDRNGHEDLRGHLALGLQNNRADHWRVALREFRAEPFHGSGAGTFQRVWERERPSPPVKVLDAHSLYLETLSELGWPGMLFLGIALLVPMGFAVVRLWGPERHAHAAFVAAGFALLLHAALDWDWEMPALFVWFFGASGVVLAAPVRERVGEAGRLTRIVAGLACLGLALTPYAVARSQDGLDRSIHALRKGDCKTAVDGALDSIDALSARAEPYEVLGYCDARFRRNDLAIRAMRSARARDPDGWEYAYGLAITQALAGQDPSAAVADARRLNPLEPLAIRLQKAMRGRTPKQRARAAGRLPIPYD